MTRKYKTNWTGKRNVARFHVTFDAAKIASEIKEACTICGGKIEAQPMMHGVCYTCYRDLVSSEELVKEKAKALQIVLDVATKPEIEPWNEIPDVSRVDRVIISAEFSKRWTTNPEHYKEHFHTSDVEVKE